MTDDGSILFAGTNDYLHVDTNSVVEEGSGLLLQVSSAGSVIRDLRLQGPRHVHSTDWSGGRAARLSSWGGTTGRPPTPATATRTAPPASCAPCSAASA
jgi:hypothetical protein